MNIEDIISYAEQGILAIDEDPIIAENFSDVELAHLRYRQLLLVASLAKSLECMSASLMSIKFNVDRIDSNTCEAPELENISKALNHMNRLTESR